MNITSTDSNKTLTLTAAFAQIVQLEIQQNNLMNITKRFEAALRKTRELKAQLPINEQHPLAVIDTHLSKLHNQLRLTSWPVRALEEAMRLNEQIEMPLRFKTIHNAYGLSLAQLVTNLESDLRFLDSYANRAGASYGQIVEALLAESVV